MQDIAEHWAPGTKFCSAAKKCTNLHRFAPICTVGLIDHYFLRVQVLSAFFLSG
jgi:hypothetical protein